NRLAQYFGQRFDRRQSYSQPRERSRARYCGKSSNLALIESVAGKHGRDLRNQLGGKCAALEREYLQGLEAVVRLIGAHADAYQRDAAVLARCVYGEKDHRSAEGCSEMADVFGGI